MNDVDIIDKLNITVGSLYCEMDDSLGLEESREFVCRKHLKFRVSALPFPAFSP